MAQAKRVVVRKHPTIKTLNNERLKRIMYVKSKMPYISALKRITKWLHQLEKNKNGGKHIVLLGMGRAVEKTLSIASYFQEKKGHRIEVKTITTQVVDEVMNSAQSDEDDSNNEDRETSLEVRNVCGVEVNVYPL